MFGSIADIRFEERRLVWTTFLVLFGVMGSHAILEAARDALFLSQLPSSRLPWVYMGVAFFSLLIYAAQQMRGVRASVFSLSRLLVLSAGLTLAFWLALDRMDTWILYALYMWPGILATTVIIRFWTLASNLFTVGQAKRLYALIGAGAVLGAIFGSAVARALLSMRPDEDLLLASVVLLLVTACGPVLLIPRSSTTQELAPSGDPPVSRKPATAESVFLRPLRQVRRSPYLRRVGSMILLSTLAFTIVDFLFKSMVAERIEPQRLGEFFSMTYVLLNSLSLFAQVFLVGWLLRILGVNQVLGVLPLLMLLGTFGFLLGGGLIAAFILKGFDGMLRNSLHRTASEVLYVPLTGEVRNSVKGWLDVLGQRGGQALASMLILALGMLDFGVTALGIVLLGLTLWWIRTIFSLEAHYLDLFRDTLRKVAGRPETAFQELDLESLESLLERLNSPNDSEVIASLELLSEQGRVRVIPALILYHPNCDVVQRALEIFTKAGREDVVPIARRLLENPNSEVRAAAVRSLAWLMPPDPELYETLTNDLSPMVRATALVGLVSFVQSPQAAVRLALMAKDGSLEEKIALARAIRWSPGGGYDDVLLKLIEADNHTLQLRTIEAMQEIRSATFIPVLMQMLPFRDLRKPAQQCLLRIGPDALAEADRLLGDQQFNASIRRHLPRVITQFDPQQAADILMRHLDREGFGDVRYRILRGLGRLRAQNPQVQLDAAVLRRTLESAVGRVYRLMDWRLKLQAAATADPRLATEVQGLLLLLLEHKERLVGERLFRLIGLLYPGEDMVSVYRGATSANLRLRDSSQELLEHVLEGDLREPIRALIDDLPDAERVRRAGRFFIHRPQTYEDVLAGLLQESGVGMRSLVIYHIGELRLVSLRETVATQPSDLRGVIARTVDRTLALLDTLHGKPISEEV